MKIGFVCPTGNRKGHFGFWITRLCNEIAKKGYDVIVVTDKLEYKKYTSKPILFKVLEVENGKYNFAQYESTPESIKYWYAYFRNSWVIPQKAFELASRENIRVFFLLGAEYMTISILLRFLRLKTFKLPPLVWIIEASNFSFTTYTGPWWKRLYKEIQGRVVKGIFKNNSNVKAIITVTEWHKDNLRKQLNLPDDFPVEVCGDGADDGILIEKLEARKRLGINYEGTIILYLGTIRTDKGVEDLIKATLYLDEIDVKIIIAGWPQHYTTKELEKMIHAFGRPDKILARFEYIPDSELPFYYNACDAVIFPYNRSYTGGTGPLTKGACSYRKPVIITNVSGMYSIVKTYQFGLIAEAENPESIAEKIKEFTLLNEEERKLLSERSYNFGKANSWETLAQRFINVAQKILSREIQ
ncbi:MAG: glycosyltransferase family 4 protein [Candidatus Micrarchaeia archaeon]